MFKALPLLACPQLHKRTLNVGDGEWTLLLLKPDTAPHPRVAKVLRERLDRLQLAVVHEETRLTLTRGQVKKLYEHVAKTHFYNELVDFMSEAPVHLFVLHGPQAVSRTRKMLGETDPAKARLVDLDSLRAVYGTNKTRNGFHASDTVDSFIRELQLLCPGLF